MRPLLVLVFAFALAACTTEGGSPGDPQPDAAVAMDAAPAIDAQRTPDAATATVCAMKDPVVQLIYTCDFQWSQCSGTSSQNHEISCEIKAAGSLRFSLCECMRGGVSQMQFTSTTMCGLGSWEELEAAANTQCGWNLQ